MISERGFVFRPVKRCSPILRSNLYNIYYHSALGGGSAQVAIRCSCYTPRAAAEKSFIAFSLLFNERIVFYNADNKYLAKHRERNPDFRDANKRRIDTRSHTNLAVRVGGLHNNANKAHKYRSEYVIISKCMRVRIVSWMEGKTIFPC
jgi:hypothetical protein